MKRIRKKAAGVCFILLSLMLSACEKYLDEKPTKALATPSTLADVRALLDDQMILNFRSPSLGENFTDDYFVTDAIFNARSITDQEVYTWRLQYYDYNNDWARAYYVINICNIALETLDRIARTAPTASEWDWLRGNALALRADMFMKIVWLYAPAYDKATAAQDLGIVLRTTSDINEPSRRATVAECYEKIIADLKEAAALLPDAQAATTRPTSYAAYGLLARVYLSLREYDNAYHYADLCLEKHKHDVLDFNTDIAIKQGSALTFSPYNVEEIFTTRIGIWSPSIGSNVNARLDTVLFDMYAEGDIRKQAFFFEQPDGMRYKGAYARTTGERFTGIATPEVLLIKVECAVRSGDIETGLQELNAFLRKRWEADKFIPYAAENEAEALNSVLAERRKELVFRGLRFIDIKRLNKEGRDIVVKRQVNGELISIPPNDKRYALPLPADIVAITGMPQNPF